MVPTCHQALARACNRRVRVGHGRSGRDQFGFVTEPGRGAMDPKRLRSVPLFEGPRRSSASLENGPTRSTSSPAITSPAKEPWHMSSSSSSRAPQTSSKATITSERSAPAISSERSGSSNQGVGRHRSSPPQHASHSHGDERVHSMEGHSPGVAEHVPTKLRERVARALGT